jgi:hypothetical protein
MNRSPLPPGLAALLAMGLMGSMGRRPGHPLDDLLAGRDQVTEDAFAGHHSHDASAADHVEGRAPRGIALDIESLGPSFLDIEGDDRTMTILLGPHGRIHHLQPGEDLTEVLDDMLGGNEPVTDETIAGPRVDENDRVQVERALTPLGRLIFPGFGPKPTPEPRSYARAATDYALKDAENKLLKRVFLTNVIMQLQVLQALEVPGFGPDEDDMAEDMIDYLQLIRDAIPE